MASFGRHHMLSAFSHLVLAWCLGISHCFGHERKAATTLLGSGSSILGKTGQLSLRRQPPQPEVWQLMTPVVAPPPVAQTSGSKLQMAVDQKLQELDQEAANVIRANSATITLEANMKRQAGLKAVEEEIPIAASNDTLALTQAVEKQEKELNASFARGAKAANDDALEVKAKADKAIELTVAYEVKSVEQMALNAVQNISAKSQMMEAEANALSKEVQGASQFSQQAFNNSEMWVNMLPKQEAMETQHLADESQYASAQVMHKTAGAMRTAKLAGNLALDTFRLAALAQQYLEKAELEATQTGHQAAQNAMELNTVHDLILKSRRIAQAKLSR